VVGGLVTSAIWGFHGFDFGFVSIFEILERRGFTLAGVKTQS
jgi:hypothetical protein